MSKPPAGRRAFEAMGRRAYSLGLPISHDRRSKLCWAEYARRAWAAGWIMQAPIKNKEPK